MISKAILLLIFFLWSFTTIICQYTPHTMFSISLNEQLLNRQLKNNKMTIEYDLSQKTNQLEGCKAMGSISQMNLRNSSNLEFYFLYKLQDKNLTLVIDIFAKNHDDTPLSSNLLIVLDFIIAKFPDQFTIKRFNMTSYQEHIVFVNGFTYQMLMFLNGFNNLTKSGGVTHSYQDGADVYTVHYMSKEGEGMFMGWKQGQEYLLFTIAIIPIDKTVQKFRLLSKSFSLNYPQGYKYFYGIKGTSQPQFVGSFSEKNNGVRFQAQKLGINKTYGLAFMPVPETRFIDSRIHKSISPLLQTFAIMLITGVIISMLMCVIFRKRVYSLFFGNSNLINQQNDFNISQVTDAPKNQIKNSDQSRQKYEINTVAQVEEKYEVSRRPSYGNNMQLKQPELAFQE